MIIIAVVLVAGLILLGKSDGDKESKKSEETKKSGESKKTEAITDGEMIELDELGDRYKIYIEDHKKDFNDVSHYKLINLLGDETPELLCFNKWYKGKFLTFDGQRTSTVEVFPSIVVDENSLHLGPEVNSDLKIVMYYRNPGEGFAFCINDKDSRFATEKIMEISITENATFFYDQTSISAEEVFRNGIVQICLIKQEKNTKKIKRKSSVNTRIHLF